MPPLSMTVPVAVLLEKTVCVPPLSTVPLATAPVPGKPTS